MGGFPEPSIEVADWDVIVVGHLKWNRYFGEGPDAPPRGDPSTCTSTLVRGFDREGRPFALLVDPTLRLRAEDYYFDLNRRTGLHPADVTHCFCTHHHMDHQIGLNYFPGALWCAAAPTQEDLRDSTYIDASRVRAVEGEFLPGLVALPLPGHSASLHGLLFRSGGLTVVVAGDAAMTKRHFARETTEFEQDAAEAARSIRLLKAGADIVVPGHDNAVFVKGVPCTT